MRVFRWSLRCRSELSPTIAATALCVLLGLASVPGASATAADSAAAPSPAAATVKAPDYFVYQPASLPAKGPVRLMLVLHGMGGNGPDFASAFTSVADRHGWLLAAPTLAYGDWRNPDNVRTEDVRLSQQLEALLLDLPQRTGRTLKTGVLLAGFSRGAQMADRFAYLYPGQLAAVASLSAGTYTLPWSTASGISGSEALDFPFGTADLAQVAGHALNVASLRQVPFWLSVGAEDTNPADVPRQWDTLLGQTRVERARSFEHALESVGVSVQLTIYPGAKHQVNRSMTDGVDQFFGAMTA